MPEPVISQARKISTAVDGNAKRHKKSHRRHPQSTVFVPTLTRPHPLRIRPSGNALLSITARTRVDTLGPLFGRLPDELLMTVLQEVEKPRDLLALGHTCKALFGYCWNDELWKHMVYQDAKKRTPEKWYGSWRRTYWQMTSDDEARVDCRDVVFSDLLYRPFQCSQIDYKKILERALQEDMEEEGDNSEGESRLIPIFKEGEMTLDKFNQEWYNKPFMLNLDTPVATWTVPELVTRFGDTVFRQEYMDWRLRVYNEYMQDNRDESPLYLFDCRSEAIRARRRREVDAQTGAAVVHTTGGELSQEYRVPGAAFTRETNDAFTAFGARVRPNHRWLILGPARSGSSFHKDPNATSAWNAVVTGHKYWIMFPSRGAAGQVLVPPGVGTDEAESEVTAPVSIAEWFQSGYYDAARSTPGFCHGICGPGQMVHVPGGWWHLVVNLDECLALTGNFVPLVRVPDVMDFLHNKHDQISGFKWSAVEQALKNSYTTEYATTGPSDDADDNDDSGVDDGLEEDDDECGCDDGVDFSKYVFYLLVSKIMQSGNAAFVGALQKTFARMPLQMLMRDKDHAKQKSLAEQEERDAEEEGGAEEQHHSVSRKWQSLVQGSAAAAAPRGESSGNGFSFGFAIDTDELDDDLA